MLRRFGLASVVFMLATLALGCLDEGPTGTGPQTGRVPPGAVCGDGVCSLSETATSCPVDCGRWTRCGDGVCSAGETCASCPDDCAAACAPACEATDLGVALPVRVDGSTSSAPSGVDVATCGDGTASPIQRYGFAAVAPGLYRISASGTFAILVDVRLQSCAGAEGGCEVADSGAIATFDVALAGGQLIIIEVAGLGGGAGDFSLDITREPPACDNQVCEQGETCSSCPSDCGPCSPPAICGDGVCETGEGCGSCEADCGSCATPTCGDLICEPGESCAFCPTDCGTCGPTCGDGVCELGEDCTTCPFDCGTCGPTCGDGVCDTGEDCASCPTDCGTCGSTCGDGTCDAGEDCASCPTDCGTCDDDP